MRRKAAFPSRMKMEKSKKKKGNTVSEVLQILSLGCKWIS